MTIPTPAQLEELSNADFRVIDIKLDVYFDGPGEDPVSFDRDVVASLTLLEEASADSENPLGAVSSNEISVELDNTNRVFAYNNTASPYHGKIKPYVMVKPYIVMDTFEVPLGVFWTDDWKVPTQSVMAEFDAYDLLYFIGDEVVENLKVGLNTNIKEMFEKVFASVGLSAPSFNIDSSLEAVEVKMGWVKRDKLRNVLQDLCIAGRCSTYVDREGIIQVVPVDISGGTADIEWTEEEIEFMDIPTEYLNTYSEVVVKKYTPMLSAIQQLVSMDNVTFSSGDTYLMNVNLQGPVAYITSLSLVGTTNCVVELVDFDAWTATVKVTNSGAAEEGALRIYGRVVQSDIDEISEIDTSMVEYRPFQLDNYLIQDKAAAEQYANDLLELLSNPARFIKMNARGNPALTLNHILEVNNATDKIEGIDVLVRRQTIRYNGPMDCEVEGIILPEGE